MTPPIQALLGNVFDYAGMFPPASLPLPAAVENYLNYRHSHPWLLGRLVCSLANLPSLLARTELQTAAPLQIAVTARCDHWHPDSDEDFAELVALLQAAASSAGAIKGVSCSLELAFAQTSAESWLSHGDPTSLIESLRRALTSRPQSFDSVFIELPWELLAPSSPILARLANVILTANADSNLRFGAKFRTGGLAPQAFPSAGQLAQAISVCRFHSVCWKATAGLHHPLRHLEASIGVHAHGFINVLVAAALAGRDGVSVDTLERVLLEESPQAFSWSSDGLLLDGPDFANVRVLTEQLSAARRDFMRGIGSCSIDEPLGDLRQLGWL